MPRRFMRDSSVVRFSPRRCAAPLAPATTPLVSFSTRTISWYSSSPSFAASATGVGSGVSSPANASSGIDSCNTLPRVSSTARSITFSSSRTLPGHSIWLSVRSVSAGMLSILRPRRRAILKVKAFTSSGISSGRSRSGGRWIGKTLRR